MPGIREIFVDLQGGRLVAGLKDPTPINSNSFSRPFHQDSLNLNIHFLTLDPSADPRIGSFRIVSVNGAALTVKVYKASDGSLLASQTVWAIADAAQTVLTGSLNLHTTDMETAFSALNPTDQLACLLEFTLTLPDGQYTVRYDQLQIRKQLNTAGAPQAAVNTRYLTADECLQIFVRFVANPRGASIELVSANGTYARELACNDDGSNATNSEQ